MRIYDKAAERRYVITAEIAKAIALTGGCGRRIDGPSARSPRPDDFTILHVRPASGRPRVNRQAATDVAGSAAPVSRLRLRAAPGRPARLTRARPAAGRQRPPALPTRNAEAFPVGRPGGPPRRRAEGRRPRPLHHEGDGHDRQVRRAAEVTDRIIAAIEAGTPPWRSRGPETGAAQPFRCGPAASYRGINVILLWLEADAKGYASPHWFTYRQAQELGPRSGRGEKSAPVIKFGTFDTERPSRRARMPQPAR